MIITTEHDSKFNLSFLSHTIFELKNSLKQQILAVSFEESTITNSLSTLLINWNMFSYLKDNECVLYEDRK